ncbi:putative cupin domain protein [Lyophyllum shimeji]|uniref:Cupin domain protein n=1 Tax=Lyophyllum shimeji TaxID=47721 RepID=A0A9P3PIM3_LYOSH|nr:putative cupin domain protein [Lyophyllum shimeji]
MSNPQYQLPDLRRIVTGHDEHAKGVVQSDTRLVAEEMKTVKGAKSAAIWVTTDSIPTNDTNNPDDGATRKIDDRANFGLVHPTGTNLRSTDLAPGAVTPMHRTSSLDYNILVQGELILMMEDGTEKHLKNPGDTVVQKGTLHAWRNPSKNWARWVTVLIAAEPAIVKDGALDPVFLPPPGIRRE